MAGDAVFCAQEEYPAATLKSDAMLRIFNDLVELRKGFPLRKRRYATRKWSQLIEFTVNVPILRQFCGQNNATGKGTLSVNSVAEV